MVKNCLQYSIRLAATQAECMGIGVLSATAVVVLTIWYAKLNQQPNKGDGE
jgi:hypothetical protein